MTLKCHSYKENNNTKFSFKFGKYFKYYTLKHNNLFSMENISIRNSRPKFLLLTKVLEIMENCQENIDRVRFLQRHPGKMNFVWNILIFLLIFQQSNTFQDCICLSLFISFYPSVENQCSTTVLKKKIQRRNLPVHDSVSVKFLLCFHEPGA